MAKMSSIFTSRFFELILLNISVKGSKSTFVEYDYPIKNDEACFLHQKAENLIFPKLDKKFEISPFLHKNCLDFFHQGIKELSVSRGH